MGEARHCIICEDEIPATAHRLKKICGKKDCLLEQQRRSTRKSYHKLLGHTEPEKRSCVVCSDDITHLRGNRVVCEKESCLKERKRRSGYAYFERNSSNLSVREKNRMNQAKYRASKPKAQRRCQICRDDITGLPGARTICYKISCEEYRDRLRAAKGSGSSTPKTPRTPKPARPTINKNYQRVPTAASRKPIIRPKPAPAPKRVIEDDEPWMPRTFNIPTSMPQHQKIDRPEASKTFMDPWNCHACRTAQELCRLHQSMEDDGSRPPSFAATSIMKK